jgi:SAM-dependent methyltransferase
VEADLSNRVDAVPERFVPAEAEGELTEAEHFARYWWAARLAEGRRVLDAGCGIGYGSNLLAARGAAEVVGIDVAEAVIEAARPTAAANVVFRQASIHELPFEDGGFDLITCFEVIEHIENRDHALGELARVLADDGVLLISSPNRDVYVPGNPHHVFEYRPEEFREALREHFAHVSLRRQHDWIGSAVLDDELSASKDLTSIGDLAAGKMVGAAPGTEPYTIGLAGHQTLPSVGPAMVLTGLAEVRKWHELWEEQQEVLRGQHEHFQNLESQWHELGTLREQLAQTEAELSRVVELEQRCQDLALERDILKRHMHALDGRIGELEAHANELQTTARAVYASLSWRITKPLRAAKRLGRSG